MLVIYEEKNIFQSIKVYHQKKAIHSIDNLLKTFVKLVIRNVFHAVVERAKLK